MLRKSSTLATVVFVSDGESEEFSPGYGDYAGVERGIVLCDDDGNLKTIGDPEELLQLIDRAEGGEPWPSAEHGVPMTDFNKPSQGHW